MSARFEHVIDAVADYCGVTRADVLSKSRMRPVVAARQVATYVLRNHLIPQPSYPVLAREMRNKDHTSAMSAVQAAERKIARDAWFAGAVIVGRAATERVNLVSRSVLAKCRLELDGSLGPLEPMAPVIPELVSAMGAE
jgi:hypothetical protein